MTVLKGKEAACRMSHECTVLDHPQHSPDLAPNDFILLVRKRFSADGDEYWAVVSWLKALDTDFFHAGVDALLPR
jgi:hypothetical protein